MSILTSIPGGSGTLPQSPSTNRSSDYRATDEVRLRANVMANNDNPMQRGAIKRLDQTMQADTPPREDVPRGYYLDILV